MFLTDLALPPDLRLVLRSGASSEMTKVYCYMWLGFHVCKPMMLGLTVPYIIWVAAAVRFEGLDGTLSVF